MVKLLPSHRLMFIPALFSLLVCCKSSSQEPPIQNDIRMLVFTKTNGYRHQSIEQGVRALGKLAEAEGIFMEHTEDSLQFNPENLAQFRLVVFLSTTQDVLGTEQEQAFENFIRNGGSFMGIHAATDTEYDWAWYGELVGAYFKSHPSQQQASLQIKDKDHPSTRHLEGTWEHFDEWYNFKEIQPGIQVLLNLDENSYEGGENGPEHPIAWFREFDGGRMFYTGLGHTREAFDNPLFLEHLRGGILYCLGVN